MDPKLENGSTLHWLQIPELIKFKVVILTYKVLHSCVPSYLGSFTIVADLPDRRDLRSSGTGHLIQPLVNHLAVSGPAFQVAGLQLRNN